MSKKSSIFTAVVLLLLGVGVACWTTLFFRHREVTLSVAPPQSAKPLVALFENLPPNPNADQYAEYIHALGKSLSLEQQRALVAWMSGQKPAQIHERNWHYLSNEIMDKLVTKGAKGGTTYEIIYAFNAPAQPQPIQSQLASPN